MTPSEHPDSSIDPMGFAMKCRIQESLNALRPALESAGFGITRELSTRWVREVGQWASCLEGGFLFHGDDAGPRLQLNVSICCAVDRSSAEYGLLQTWKVIQHLDYTQAVPAQCVLLKQQAHTHRISLRQLCAMTPGATTKHFDQPLSTAELSPADAHGFVAKLLEAVAPLQ